MGGHVNGVIMDLPALDSQVKGGKLRAIAVTNNERTPVLPDVPTSGEQGLAGVQAVNWFALMAPAKTPAAVVARINDALVKVCAMPEVKEAFGRTGVAAFNQASPDAFRKFLGEEITRWGTIARDAGAKAN
jgi:tripartite-type tricarboxylate transporter receptor subunit TctC